MTKSNSKNTVITAVFGNFLNDFLALVNFAVGYDEKLTLATDFNFLLKSSSSIESISVPPKLARILSMKVLAFSMFESTFSEDSSKSLSYLVPKRIMLK